MSFLVLGLGNPGDEYAETRHNAGFMVVDRLAALLGCSFRRPFFQEYHLARATAGGKPLFLAKPMTYMNLSGRVLPHLLKKCRCGLGDLLVVCDNLDLPAGSCRLKLRGSSAGHNGLASLIEYAGSSDFKRLYVGIGRPRGGGVVEHVLGTPTGPERELLSNAVGTAADGVLALTEQTIHQVMNELNGRKT